MSQNESCTQIKDVEERVNSHGMFARKLVRHHLLQTNRRNCRLSVRAKNCESHWPTCQVTAATRSSFCDGIRNRSRVEWTCVAAANKSFCLLCVLDTSNRFELNSLIRIANFKLSLGNGHFKRRTLLILKLLLTFVCFLKGNRRLWL